MIQREDVLRESTTCREDVVSNIVDQRLIRDAAIAQIVALKTRLVDVSQAEVTAARNRDVSATTLKTQTTATYATRTFSMAMLRLYMAKHNFVGQQIR